MPFYSKQIRQRRDGPVALLLSADAAVVEQRTIRLLAPQFAPIYVQAAYTLFGSQRRALVCNIGEALGPYCQNIASFVIPDSGRLVLGQEPKEPLLTR
jgi:hypothetical protein